MTTSQARTAGDLLSVVIAACNEDEELAATVESIRAATEGPVEWRVIDDASSRPQPYATHRNARRIGSPRSRQLGCSQATGRWVFFVDGHMKIPKGLPRRLVALAEATGGWAYCGCNGHRAAELRMVGGLLYSKWHAPTAPGVAQETGMMGAAYVIERARLNRMGGWIGLPGYLGSQELCMSMLAARHRVPITVDAGVETWHHFRNDAELPYPPAHDLWLLNMACAYRLLFGDAAWAVWRRRLAVGWVAKEGEAPRPIPESILREAERPDLLRYGEALRARFVVSDEEFMEPFGGLK